MQTQRRDLRPRGGPDNGSRRDSSDALEHDPIVGELRKIYDGIVEEPVPDHLVDLLRKLDEVERSR